MKANKQTFALVLKFDGKNAYGEKHAPKCYAIGTRKHCKSVEDRFEMIELPHGAYSYRFEIWTLKHLLEQSERVRLEGNAQQDLIDVGF